MSENKNKTVLDPDMLSEALKAQTKDTLEVLLEKAVKSYLKESAEEEDLENDADKVEPAEVEGGDEPTVDEVPAEGETPVEDGETAPEEPVDGAAEEPVDGESDEWSNFNDFKVGDGEYDMTGAGIEDVARVWKLMSDGDNVVVKQQDGKIELKDNESGAEYLIDTKGASEPEGEEAEEEPIFEITLNDKSIMKEENLGYTDNYQNKDVVVGKEPYDAATPNETNDWDKAPEDKEKPWAGPVKDKGKPYAGEVNEEEGGAEGGNLFEITFDECGGGVKPVDGPMEEGATFPDENSMRLNPGNEVHDEPHRRRHNDKEGNMSDGTAMNEAIQKKLAVIEEENKVLKSSLVKFRKALNEAVLTNYNIGNFVNLIIENSTTKQEKINILERFSKEAKTKEQSKALYESINKELKSVKKGSVAIDKPMNINESAVKNINESTIYKNDDEAINYALDMIQRMNNL